MQIGIVGLGLIGGSLGLKWRSQGHQIIGVSRRADTCSRALQLGAADTATTALNALKAAEVIVLATPLSAIAPTVAQLVPLLQPETCLTDVGSAKAAIVSSIEALWPNFIGGHPMAGKAASGIDVADANLFENCPYVLTPTANTPQAAIAKVTQLAQSLGSRLYTCSPAEHDRAVAWISHLPVMISASLIQACLQEANPNILELAQQLASSGFRDTSRVGGGSPELGVMMARHNQAAVLQSLAQYRQQLDQLTTWIEAENWAALSQSLTVTQQARPEFL
ncbi:MAG: prephenate/arogenate dehydrogenase [Cyanobacteria bacterium P01_H01_bin.121]